MAELYYNQPDDAARFKIGFILVNDDGALADLNGLKASGSYRGKFLPVVQDDSGSTIMNAISNKNPWPKDDMAVIDKDGHMIKYFTSRYSAMGNRQNNNVRSFVMELSKAEYKNPCAAEIEVGKEKEKDKSEKDSEDMAIQNGLYKLKEACRQTEADCLDCSGRFKNNKCFLKKKMKCSVLKSEVLCKLAECKYSKAKKGKKAKKGRPSKKEKPAKCKGKGIFQTRSG
eukprot:TRINITY_DN376_c0_g1_i1.p1 TRINITY_DN376_c0_g1~~TRINITY_DN376_c0_g1_i1.p1  ORF type:complete len:228 (-),score=79.41 TRINITY_DN376_c0_g1_i1:683-1366(-)